MADTLIIETDRYDSVPDPDLTPVRDRKLVTNSYDLVIVSLLDQIENGTIFLNPLTERPDFQRRYVWTPKLASKLIESILLNVPIPPCYLSQNKNYELDVIDGQQRLVSIYKFINNEIKLTNLEVLTELNGKRYHEIERKLQRQLNTHTLRCVLITNESHPEIKFDVFERLNTNTVPLNAQEIRNCVYRGDLNNLLKDAVQYQPWLEIIQRKSPDKRMKDEELVLRFFSFFSKGVESYKTPQKNWLNETAQAGMEMTQADLSKFLQAWKQSIDVTRIWFPSNECFRRSDMPLGKAINRALFDLTTTFALSCSADRAAAIRSEFRKKYRALFSNEEFVDLISKSVDHKRRTLRRFEIWENSITSQF